MQFAAHALKKLRIERKLTQKEIADLADVALRSYSDWENGKQDNPDMENIRKIAKALRVEPHVLFELRDDAHSEAIKEPRPDYPMASNARPVSQDLKRVKVVSWASCGAANDYSDMANQIDDYVYSECKDPNAFALIAEGDSMEIEIHAGDILVFAPGATPRNGDIVAARFVESLGVTVKRFQRKGPEGKTILLIPSNPNYSNREYPEESFLWIYPAVDLSRKLRS